MCCSLCKTLRTILEVDKGRIQTNRPEDKKVLTIHEGLHSRDDTDRFYVSRKEEGRGLVSIEDCIDTSIRRFKNYIKKNKERLITSPRKNAGNRFGLVWFYGISTFEGYLTPNPFLCKKWFSISTQYKCKNGLIFKNISTLSHSV